MGKFFLLVLITFTISIFGDVVEDGLKQLSLKDRLYMKMFFEEAFKQDQAAHVLCFMNKPVCLTGPVLRDRHKTFKDILLLKGWLAFKNHEHLFPHPNFIFSENIFSPDKDFKVLHIYFINKKSLVKCLEYHLHLFTERLGENFSVPTFVSQLEKGASLPILLNEDEMLLGVLLGFGEESSKAFKEIVENHTETFAPPTTDTYCRIDLNCPKGCKLSPVVFMGNPYSSEVQQLISIYEKELEDAWAEYKQSKDPLKMVLKKLCEE